MHSHIVFDAEWCRTCRVCETACSIAKESEARPSISRINVFFDEFSEGHPIYASVCTQCPEAPCIDSCPVDAMERDARTGAVLIDDELCIGCLKCREACPWQVPKRHPERKIAIKCDLCAERNDGPLCVLMCPLSGKALRCEPNECEPEVSS
jgi:Fe-S-cluster-containing dehydrogenase component